MILDQYRSCRLRNECVGLGRRGVHDVSSHRGMASRPSFPTLFSGLAPAEAWRRRNRAEPPPVIKLKSPREIALMREAGRVVAKALDQVRRMAVPGVTTAEMDEAVAAIFREHDAHPAVPGLSQLGQGKAAVPGGDLRQRQRAGRARHPQPPPAARGGHRLDRHRLQGQRLVRRLGGDPGHRRGPARDPEAAGRDRPRP